MAWPNPFRRRNENTRTCWGYTFQLTKDHLTPKQTHPMKYSFDRLGDEAYSRLDVISKQQHTLISQEKPVKPIKPSLRECQKNASSQETVIKPKRDLYILLRDNAQSDPVLSQLWTEAHTVPSWVDWASVARGQDVFYRYGGPALTGLAFQSLLGGMGAARVVEVLARTGGFSTRVARHRLFETTQFILQVTQSLHSIQSGGAGHASAIRVRLLHAAVRRRIMKLAQERPDYYDVSRLGVPINDLDCIATIGTFSATLLYLSLPRQGIFVTRQEAADYTHLFRYVAHLMGTPTEHFETPQKAKTIMEVLLLYEVNPTETSKVLAHNVIKCLMAQPPTYSSKESLEVNSRWLNGNDLCDALELGRPSLYYWALMTGQCLFFMALCYTYRLVPYLDRRKIKALRKIFWAIIVENKSGLGEEAVFEFKYIPDFSKKTQPEEPETCGLKRPGVEWRNLKAFVVGCCVLAILSYCSVRALGSILLSLRGSFTVSHT